MKYFSLLQIIKNLNVSCLTLINFGEELRAMIKVQDSCLDVIEIAYLSRRQ